jgi:hypothetical protein
MLPRCPWLLPLVLACGCAAPRYRVTPPAAGWQRVGTPGDSVAFSHPAGGTMAAHATCQDAEDVPLDVLTNHLLFGVEQRRERSRVPTTVSGRGALRTRLTGTLDGVPVGLDLVVLKKDGCTYDLLLIAAPGTIAARQPEFERFVAGFSGGP